MPTVNIVPRADNEGSVGTTRKKWTGVHAHSVNADEIFATTINTSDIKKDGKSLVTADEVAGSNPIRQKSTAYILGDMVKDASLPSWAYLECAKAGTTASTDLPQNSMEGVL